VSVQLPDVGINQTSVQFNPEDVVPGILTFGWAQDNASAKLNDCYRGDSQGTAFGRIESVSQLALSTHSRHGDRREAAVQPRESGLSG